MPLYVELIYIFSFLGICDTLYLSYHAITKTPVACWFFPAEWCHTVQYSKYSKTFGIPNPYLGLFMYIIILALTLAFRASLIPFWPIAAIIAFGFAFSMYFTYIQAFILKAFCTWCVVSAINFTVLFAAAFFIR